MCRNPSSASRKSTAHRANVIPFWFCGTLLQSDSLTFKISNMFGAFSTRQQWLGDETFCYPDLDAFFAGEIGRIPAVDVLRRHRDATSSHESMLVGATIQGVIAFDDLPFKKKISAIASEFLGTKRPVVKLFISASPVAWGLHQDPDDMLVLQLLGAKLWRLGFPILERKGEATSLVIPSERLDESGQRLHDQLLEAGSMLYLPRDTAHWVSYDVDQCKPDASPSVHLTLGRPEPQAQPPRVEVMVIFHG